MFYAHFFDLHFPSYHISLLTPAPSQDEIILREHVPRRVSHDNRPWWHPLATRQSALTLLGGLRKDGAFLVRPSASPYSYAISFRAEGKIKHCGIQTEGLDGVRGYVYVVRVQECCGFETLNLLSFPRCAFICQVLTSNSV